MNTLHAIILGIVEGFTEFLPISSTAHLMITSRLMGLGDAEFVKSFEIIIQLGAILAVISMYWKKLITDLTLVGKIIVDFIPTGIIGFVLYPVIKSSFLENMLLMLAMLGIGGAVLILFEIIYKKKMDAKTTNVNMTYFSAFIIGCAQALSVIPGVSRAAATIIGGLSLGFSREAIVEFSFLLAIPTMAAATGYDLLKNIDSFSMNDISLLTIGLVVSFIVARVAITSFLKFIRTNSFINFGVYRIIVSLAALLLWF